MALADFVAPEGTPDYLGGFVVTAGLEENPSPSGSSVKTTTTRRS
jgi:cobalamin-dependent methionine synthase I